jgi:hypothetical protein
MKLQRREKILVAVAGGLTLSLAVWFLFFSGGSLSYGNLISRRDQLTLDVAKKENEVKAASTAARRLTEWQRHALPSDMADARAQYQAWLRDLADRFQFQQPLIEVAGVDLKPKSCVLKYKINGRTNIAKLIEFLHEFYSAGHLHQISSLDVSAVPNSPELTVKIDIEAMSLPSADRKNKLTAERGKSLQLKTLADYNQAIANGKIFAMPQGPADIAIMTFVTAILAVDGRGEAWLVNRMSGQNWQLHENDQFQVGMLRGTVKSIGTHDLVIEVDGRPRRFRSGNSLRAGEEIQEPKQEQKSKPEQKPTPESKTDQKPTPKTKQDQKPKPKQEKNPKQKP